MNTYSEDDLKLFKEWLLQQEISCPECGMKFRFDEKVQIELTGYSMRPFEIKTGIVGCGRCNSVFFPNEGELLEKYLNQKP